MTKRTLEVILNLQGSEGAAARLVYVQALIERAKKVSAVSHHLALDYIEKAVEKFDGGFMAHMTVVRDFFGEFWQEMERNAQRTALEPIRDAVAWAGAARAFVIIDNKTKALAASLKEQTQTPTIPLFLEKLQKLKALFREDEEMLKLWREAFDERPGPIQ